MRTRPGAALDPGAGGVTDAMHQPVRRRGPRAGILDARGETWEASPAPPHRPPSTRPGRELPATEKSTPRPLTHLPRGAAPSQTPPPAPPASVLAGLRRRLPGLGLSWGQGQGPPHCPHCQALSPFPQDQGGPARPQLAAGGHSPPGAPRATEELRTPLPVALAPGNSGWTAPVPLTDPAPLSPLPAPRAATSLPPTASCPQRRPLAPG